MMKISGGGTSPRFYGHYVDFEGRSIYVPICIRKEGDAHTITSEMTGAILGRIRKHEVKFRGWAAQVEDDGHTLPASGSMSDAVFDLLQYIAERGHRGLGLKGWD